MKILGQSHPQPVVLGRECDHCQYRVELGWSPDGGLTEVKRDRLETQKCVELAGFVTVDIDHGDHVTRADLCPQCAAEFSKTISRFLPSMRRIATRDARTGMRMFHGQAYDAETGRTLDMSSMFDHGA